MKGDAGYPFVPKSNRSLRPGQFWAIPLSDGTFGCGMVIHPRSVPSGPGSSQFVAALLDWWGPHIPTAADLGGASVRYVCHAPVKEILDTGGGILGERPVPPNAPPHPDLVRRFTLGGGLRQAAQAAWIDPAAQLPPERRGLRRPLTPDQLAPARTATGTVQITSSLDQRELALLDDWLAAHPRFHLRLHHGRQGPITDLEMLAGLPHVRHLTVDLRTCASIEGLRHARQLETLRLGAIGAGADLGPLRYLTEVRTLYLANPHRNTDVLAELGTLEDLTLRTTSLTNLDALTALPRLRVLDLQYGRFPSLDPLADFPALEHLEVQRIKHLGDIDIIARIPRLRRLMLAFLPGVTRLPDMSTATHLRDVCFEHMVGIVDLNPLAAAPGLEQVVLVDPPHTDPSGAARLATHPTLRGFSWITPRTRPSPLPPDFPKARLPDRRPFG